MTENVKLNNVNQKKSIPRRKLNKKNTFLAIMLGFGLFSSVNMISQRAEAKTGEGIMPEGYIEYYSTCSLDNNDTIYDIAQDYWVDELHGMYYLNLENYIEHIGDTNNINVNNITPYQDIIIPTLVEEQNIYLQQINALKEYTKQLDTWVQYEVQYGDTVLSLAFLGAGDTNEAYALKDEISRRNGGHDIYAGETIWIINPEIGMIKKEIVRYQQLLNESLRHNNVNETSHVPNI